MRLVLFCKATHVLTRWWVGVVCVCPLAMCWHVLCVLFRWLCVCGVLLLCVWSLFLLTIWCKKAMVGCCCCWGLLLFLCTFLCCRLCCCCCCLVLFVSVYQYKVFSWWVGSVCVCCLYSMCCVFCSCCCLCWMLLLFVVIVCTC